jgi:tetratricopeptide (TPR) repeat protein
MKPTGKGAGSGRAMTAEAPKPQPLIPLAATVAVVAFAVYFNTLGNGFVYDDNGQVLRNPWIRSAGHLPEIFYKNVWSFQASTSLSNYYRPMMHVINMASYHVFGLAAWGFHLVNVLFHAGNSVLVFLLAARLPWGSSNAKTASAPPGSRWIAGPLFPAFVAALLFAAHPIHTEAVAWIGAVTDLSLAFFFLLSFYFHLECGERENYAFRAVSVISFAVSLLCKEPAATLPFLLIAFDSAVPLGNRPWKDRLKKYLPYFAILGLYFIARTYVLRELAPVKTHGQLGAYGYVVNVFPIFAGYLGKLLLPWNLNAFHVFHPIASLMEPQGIAGLLVAIACIAAAIFLHGKNPPAFIGLVLIAVPLLPALYLPALGEAVFAERYLYLPSAGFVILLGGTFHRLRERAPRHGTAVVLAALCLVLSYSVMAAKRNPVWKDDLTLFADTVKKSPDGELPNGMLGVALMGAGRFDEAIEQFHRTLKINPASAHAHYNLGLTLLKKDRPAEAIPEFEKAIALSPKDPDARRYLANSYAQLGKTDKAIEQLRIILSSTAELRETYLDLGVALRRQGRTEEAIESYRKALAIDAGYAEAHFNLGNVFADSGKNPEAIKHYREAVKLQPGNAYFRNMLGISYGQTGSYDDARKEFEEAVRLDPSEPAYRRNLDRAAGLKKTGAGLPASGAKRNH